MRPNGTSASNRPAGRPRVPAQPRSLGRAQARTWRAVGAPPKSALPPPRDPAAGAGGWPRAAPESPAGLRDNAPSPGGTTRAALDVLMADNGLPALLDRAVAAATARSRELAN